MKDDFIKEEVREYLSKLLTKDCYKGYELQLDKICEKLELSLFDAVFTDDKISGAIYKDGDSNKFKIYVNDKHHINRKRFTIAHEIGHYISAVCESYSHEQLFKKNSGFEDAALYRMDSSYSEAENEANEIAARMLMPEESINELIEQGLSVEEMAAKFFVSPVAMSVRLYRLGIRFL